MWVIPNSGARVFGGILAGTQLSRLSSDLLRLVTLHPKFTLESPMELVKKILALRNKVD